MYCHNNVRQYKIWQGRRKCGIKSSFKEKKTYEAMWQYCGNWQMSQKQILSTMRSNYFTHSPSVLISQSKFTSFMLAPIRLSCSVICLIATVRTSRSLYTSFLTSRRHGRYGNNSINSTVYFRDQRSLGISDIDGRTRELTARWILPLDVNSCVWHHLHTKPTAQPWRTTGKPSILR